MLKIKVNTKSFTERKFGVIYLSERLYGDYM